MGDSKISRQYRERYGMDIPTRALAKIMQMENPLVFKSLESARDSLRYIEGKTGKGKNLIKSKKTEMTKYLMDEERPKNPYSLPQSDERNREPFVIPTGCNNILVMSDIHIPYFHAPTIEKAFDYGKEQNINCIILLGDVLDNHNLSLYEKDPSRRSQEEELAICKEFLRRMKAIFDVPIYWVKGNHDIRWEAYIRRNAKDLATLKNFQLESVLALHEENIITIEDKTIVKTGKLTLHHGHHLFGRFGSTNPGKTLLDKTGTDFMIGHLHRHTTYEKVTVSGVQRAYILGCMSEIGLNVDYNPIVNQYRRGFAHIKVQSNGNFEVKMIDGVY